MKWASRLFFGALWRLYQIVLMGCSLIVFYRVFGNLNERPYPLLWILGMFVFAFILTRAISVLTGRAIDLFRNGLGRRDARLPDEPDQYADRLGRAGGQPEDSLEILEVPFSEQPRKLRRPPS